MSLEHKITHLLETLEDLNSDVVEARTEGTLQLAAERDLYKEALQHIQQRVGVSTSKPGEILRDPIDIATQALRRGRS